MTSDSKYKLVRKIASGGMAEVYLAVQRGLAGFEKPVVIKRILPHLCQDEQFVQMFLDEARLAASLSHANIVQIFDVQRDAESFFIAMEYIAGEDLRFILGKFRSSKDVLPVPIACQMGIDIASGLQAAHEATDPEGKALGIIHRDVAPSNIIVSFDGTAKVVDFGVAKANVHNIYTRPGALKGKLAYNSPEQIQRKDLDSRTDVFSLGIVLWELLTSRRLFKGPSEAAVLRTVMEAPVEPPSSINKGVPKELDEIVLNALKRNRSARTATAEDVLSGLESVLKKLGESASPHAVSDWMKTAFADRLARRKSIEQDMAQQAWDSSQPSGDVPSMFSKVENSVSLLGSSGGSVSSPGSDISVAGTPTEKQGGSSKVVLYTIIGTLLVVALVAGAFYMGSQSSTEEDPGSAGEPGALASTTTPEGTTTEPAPGAKETTTTSPSTTSPSRPAGASTRKPAAARSEPVAKKTSSAAKPAPAKKSVETSRASRRAAARARRRQAARRGRRGRRDPDPSETKVAMAAQPVPEPTPRPPSVTPPPPKPKPPPAVEPTPPPPKPRQVKPKPRVQPPRPKPPKPKPKPPARPASTTGKIRVLSDAPGYIFVDGRNTGKTTPALITLPVGTHQIMVILKGSNARIRHKVRIKPKKIIRLRLRAS